MLCGAASVGVVSVAIALLGACSSRSMEPARAASSAALVGRAPRVPVSIAAERAEETPSATAISRTLSLGTFGVRSAAGSADDASDCHICALRGALPPASVAGPLPQPVAQALGRAAEALARQDAVAALRLAEEAARMAPAHSEPLEVLLLVHLARGVAGDVRGTIARLAEVDARNPIALAFAGLEAVQNGRDEDAVAALAWFVGEGAVARRGSAIPLPTALGELEEQCALAALRLGKPLAALEAIALAEELAEELAEQLAEELAEERAEERAAESKATLARLSLLRADALHALGRDREARLVLTAIADEERSASDSIVRSVAVLAGLRLDALPIDQPALDARYRDAIEACLRGPLDPLAMHRVAWLAPSASAEERERAAPRLRALAAGDPASAARMALLESLGAPVPSPELRAIVRARLAADPRDRAALRLALRHFADGGGDAGADLLCEAACEIARANPNEIDSVAAALLSSGLEAGRILTALAATGDRAVADALASRIHSLFGFAEDALLIAASARQRAPASSHALVACAMAAAELRDETILLEIDEEALAAGPTIARTLAAAWLGVGDAVRARDRAARAMAADPRDARAALIRARAALEDPVLRAQAVEALTALSVGDDATAREARASLAELAGETPVASGIVAALLDAAREFERLQLPLAFECLALAEELEPSAATIERILGRAATPSRPAALASWARRLAADAPALPARRRLAVAAAGTAGQAAAATAPAPDAGIARRHDALLVADAAARARDEVARASRRPRTPSASAAMARAQLAAGSIEEAARSVELAAASSGEIPPRAARTLLALAAEIAARDRSSARAMDRAAQVFLARRPALDQDDLFAAMRILVAARVGGEDLDARLASLARAARHASSDDRERFGALFRAIVAIERDPYQAARLAVALSRERRFDRGIRSFFGGAAIALLAASGDGASDALSIARDLHADGAEPFLRPVADAANEETARRRALAETLLRASDAFSLAGDDAGSAELLRAALAVDADLAPALNNLAFMRIEAGELDAETVALAERAAARAPDDPAVLDTLGVVRYHQGRFRDDAQGQGAVTLFRQALRLRPDDPSLATLDHLGDALWRDGDQQSAIRCWQQVAQVAELRYPAEAVGRGIAEFQRREYGVEIVAAEDFYRKRHASVVDRAARKLAEVARGEAPSVPECLGGR
jgi:hypothetical protein